MMEYGWGMSGGGWLMMIVFWALLLGVIVWGVTRLVPRSEAPGPRELPEHPEETLKRRLARGEISVEEYGAILDRLRGVERNDPEKKAEQ